MALHFILDGYNLVKQDERLALLKLEVGRWGLLKLIDERNLKGSPSNQVTVVFDGQIAESQEIFAQGINIVFTGSETADDWIKRYVEHSAAVRSLVVVTDDKEIRVYVRSLGASLMSSREFLEGRGSRRGSPGRAAKKHGAVSEKKAISTDQEIRITSEFREIWLKDKK